MEWFTGTPTKLGMYWVRRLVCEIGIYDVFYDTAFWGGGRWRIHPSDKISHYAYIEEPRLLNDDEQYGDALGRMKCVVQQEVKPDLSVPPAKP